MPDSNAPTKDQPKKVFVISPIGADGSQVRRHADLFLEFIVQAALPAPEFEVERADAHDSPYAITAAMLSSILNADICVADITGRNPNVFYELALAHAMDKPVVIMDGDKDSSPFDIKDMRALKFGLMPDEVKKAVSQLKAKALAPDLAPEFKDMMNPVAAAFRTWTAQQRVESSGSSTEQMLLQLVESLARKIDLVERRLRTPGAEPMAAVAEGTRQEVRALLNQFGLVLEGNQLGEEDIELVKEGLSLMEEQRHPKVMRGWIRRAEQVLRRVEADAGS
ncbi:hypothetical protein [Pseudarthrobacter sp. NIBRBAC000502770]|uniref:hypothetical protein n=1 Tax=Pseudarthrobacter sp. NIBRBAC000502770 TaxID=2590785 RepID=UPI001140734C|nr:hypothetical protein [Pseudarthrobacter sp. NIBRBAC000502770]QDG88837.1 hypothetical protein NIBR502770_10405 [Pseudarthrobacter sp. NIBRBAC000502770]